MRLRGRNRVSSFIASVIETNLMSESFHYCPSHFVPFRDVDEIERCRRITRDNIDKHPNPDFRIRVMPGDEIEFRWIADMFRRIKDSDDRNEPVVLIVPNPCPSVYRKVAHLINVFAVNCRNLRVFMMDEYANEDGAIAPDDWRLGFMHSFLQNFYAQISEPLRPRATKFMGRPTETLGTTAR